MTGSMDALRSTWSAGVAAALLIGGCGGADPAPPASRSPVAAATASTPPFVRVVGTAQDGGLPHVACTCDRCELARRDPERRRLVAGLAVVLGGGRVLLVDATPDLAEQLDRLGDVRDAPPGRVDRAPIDGILLTHAHIGHYLGLAFLGFEAVHTRGVPVWASRRMADYLRGHGPWSQLVALGNLELREIEAGRPFEPAPGLRVTALAAPHRDEYADTLGFVLEGARRRLLYLPDTDSWEAWAEPIESFLSEVDVALLDGTFYSPEELPGRSVASIGHPLIESSLERLAPAVAAGTEIFFTHLNHSNPALGPDDEARRRIEAAGFRVLDEGAEFEL